jgi:GTP-binding protein
MIAAKSATFVLSAPKLSVCPAETHPEVCFAGRSNVGKSSLINAVVGRKKLVKTSNVPGKTRAMNYFEIDEAWFLVDLPGYGYAKVSKTERDRWDRESKNYYLNRGSLRLIILVVDSRHQLTELDAEMALWLAENQRPFAVILSKSDKLTKNQQSASLAKTQRILRNMNMDVPVLLCSSETGAGIDPVRSLIADFINENYYIDQH